jgi:anti-sigma-K factor RskA
MHEFDLNDPDQRNQCAAEYVLGTLGPQQKSRFEALLAVSHDLQSEVEQWREHLDIFNTELPPITPPKSLWPKISAATAPQRSFSFWSWQSLSLLSVIFIMTLGLLFTQTQKEQDVYVYLIHNEQKKPGWMVNTALDQNELIIQTLNPSTPSQSNRYELWLIEAGHEPMTLGFLPLEGEKRITLQQSWKERILNCEVVVTLEGPNGAPSGYEMGPISDRAHWKAI